MKSFFKLIIFTALVALGSYIGYQLALCRRPVDSSRMEKCLLLYKNYRYDSNQEKLAKELSTLSLTPNDFQHIIDKFILYRTQKSSLKQAMQLLKAFKMGYDIEVEKVYNISGMENEPFRLDAEILTVFENKPELVKEAFEG
jgi:hypothetical protein